MATRKKKTDNSDLPEMGEEWEAVLEREIELNTRHSPTHALTEDLHINACAVSILMKEKLNDAFPPTSEGLEFETLFPEAVSFWGRRCLSAYLRDDWEFFDSLQRATATWGNRREKIKQGVVVEAELIRLATELFWTHKRNPTEAELKAASKEAGLSVGDWNRTLATSKLKAVLTGKKGRGRPRKKSG
jgi:hypothetical protein